MSFESWQAFWMMGKYGVYVWSSYGIFLVLMLGLGVRVFWQRRQLLRQLRAEQSTAKVVATAPNEWSS